MEYQAPDNIYWMFSSSAQAIAAFIGFLAAGFFFVYEKLDREIDKDETLEDVYNELKIQYFNRIKVLLILTGFSIVLSLLTVFLNGINLCPFWAPFIRIFVALLNAVTIGWAIYFIIFIIDPNKVARTTEKLIDQNKGTFNPTEGESLTRGSYLDKFLVLEKLLTFIAETHNIQLYRADREKPYVSLSQIIRMLYQRELIDAQQLRDLQEVNKVRNLSAHGKIETVELRMGNMVDSLVKDLKRKFEN